MSSTSFPRKVSSFQTSQQPVFRGSCTRDASLHPITQFLNVVRRKTGRMFTDLRPYKLHGIQFRSTSWKTIFMDTRMVVDELLCLWRDMNFVVVPDKNNVAWRQLQHVLQKDDGLLGAQIAQKGAYTQADLSQFWTDEQSAQYIHALAMVQARPSRRRLSARRPTSFER